MESKLSSDRRERIEWLKTYMRENPQAERKMVQRILMNRYNINRITANDYLFTIGVTNEKAKAEPIQQAPNSA